MMRFVFLLSTLLAAAPASADQWRMLDESAFDFEASWEGTALPGRFSEFDVRLDAEASDLTRAMLVVTVDLSGADMDDPDINEAIAGEEWFAVDKHPQATYTSQSIVETAPGEYRATGDLELKGITKSVDVPFTWLDSADGAVMSGELVIDRTRFEIGSGEWANDDSIGFDVRLSFKIVFARQ